jgi:hypothetical protein
MTDYRLFDRRVKLTVVSTTTPVFADSYDIKAEKANTLIIEDLRVQFDIKRTLKKHPNSCVIKITNLNEATRSAFKHTPLRVTLEAGYVEGVSTIFVGDVTYAISTLDGPDWITHLELGDGDRVYSHARVNKSYAAKTSYKTVLEDALKSIGQQLPENIRTHPAFNRIIEGGLALSGKHRDVLDGILKPYGFTYSSQDGQPMILHEDDTVGTTYVISEGNGMIGSPEFGKPDKKTKAPNVTIRALLYPEIRVGHPVRVESRDLTGTFKVEEVRARGDSHGDDWLTEVEVKPVPSGGASSRSKAGFGGGKSSGGGAGTSF